MKQIDKAETIAKIKFVLERADALFSEAYGFCLVPHGAIMFCGQSHRNVCELNFKPFGQSPFLTSS